MMLGETVIVPHGDLAGEDAVVVEHDTAERTVLVRVARGEGRYAYDELYAW